MNVCIYTRVSTAEQKEKGYSLAEQESRLRSYCDAKGWKLIKVYSDGGYTGKNTNRPALKQMMAGIDIYDAVLVWKLDRLSRSQKDTLILIDELQQHNCAFISLVESFDTSTSIGRAMLGILSTFAQLEREQIAERMKMGKVGRAKTGKWHGGGHAPTGYTYDKTTGTLVQNDEADQVRLIFRMFVEGKGYSDITKYMNKRYTTRYTSHNCVSTVIRMVRNPVYIGCVTHKGDIIEDCHEPIVDRDTWDKAQALIASRKNGNKNAAGRHFLSGMVFCRCGKHMTINKVGKYKYYVCARRYSNNLKDREQKCDNRRIPTRTLDEAVRNEILKLDFKDFKPKKREKFSDNTAEIRKIDKQISRLIDLYQIDSIPIDELKKKITELEKKKSVLNAPEAPVPDVKVYRSILSRAKKTFDSGDETRSRAIADALITKVVVMPENIEIHWAFS